MQQAYTSYLKYPNNLVSYFLSGVRTAGLLPRGMKREVGFFFFTNIILQKKQSKVSCMLFIAATLSCLSGPAGETKSPQSFQPCAGHPEAVQEESGELRVFLEVLCLKLPSGIDATHKSQGLH